MFKKKLICIMDNLFFNRVRTTIFCVLGMLLSFWIELNYDIENFFSSSGTLFTLAGLFLNIKRTALFHRKQIVNGKEVPLNVGSKYHLAVSASGGFAIETPLEEKQRVVNEVETDEFLGIFLMVFGTILWGYGSYFIAVLK